VTTKRYRAVTEDGETEQVPDDLAALLGPRGTGEVTAPLDAPLDSEPARSWVDLEAKLEAERGLLDAVRSRPTTQRIVLALVLVMVWIGTVLLFSRRPDFGVFPKGRMSLDILLMAAPLIVAIVVALRPLHRPALPRWVRPAVLVAAAIGVIAVIALPMAHADHPASTAGVGDDLAKRAIGCFMYGTIFAALTVLGLRALCRGPGRLWIPSLVVGAGAALAGSLALYLHCPITHALHMWLGHATVLVPLLGLSVAIGRKHGEG
jgi:hypothetical protein